MLRLSVAIILSFIFNPQSTIWVQKYTKHLTIFLWALPIILFILGVTNTFNIFNIDEEFKLSTKYEFLSNWGDNNSSFIEDTRTPVYKDIIMPAIKENYYIEGHSLARGYPSLMFGELTAEALGGNFLEGERSRSEISILNVFTYMGILGVLSYMSIFIYSSYLAVFVQEIDFYL